MIRVMNLKKALGNVQAVDGLSFSVKKGEIVGFLGPNGAGKTTTMRLLTGYLSPDEGEVKIAGKSILENTQEAQAQIGYLPENNPVYKQMLVSEILQFSGELKGMSKAELVDAVDFAVSAVAIEDVYNRPLGELSKGYKQRVGMAMALLNRPKILIMDEPTEGLDPNQRTEIRALIKDLAKDRTIIISTHVMSEATAVANRILILSKGKLVADGSPSDLIATDKDEVLVEAVISGTKLKSEISKLKSVSRVETNKVKGNKYELEIVASRKKPIQNEIAKLAAKNKWVIWKLAEREGSLEEVFKKLTGK